MDLRFTSPAVRTLRGVVNRKEVTQIMTVFHFEKYVTLSCRKDEPRILIHGRSIVPEFEKGPSIPRPPASRFCRFFFGGRRAVEADALEPAVEDGGLCGSFIPKQTPTFPLVSFHQCPGEEAHEHFWFARVGLSNEVSADSLDSRSVWQFVSFRCVVLRVRPFFMGSVNRKPQRKTRICGVGPFLVV